VSASLWLATFRADVTPPIGSPLCGGLIRPVIGVADPLWALGVLLLPEGEAPIVLCAVDWCEICNGDHLLWRETLADAAGTTPERVAVQCVHQHDAPLTDLDAQRLHREHGIVPDLMDEPSFHTALERVATAVREASPAARPVTGVRVGAAPVTHVASNRRVPGPDGKLRVRWSRCTDPELRAAPEGLIDPLLRTLSFWEGERKLAVLHYYAVHPMSYYGEGWVSADFAGLARERRSRDVGEPPHIFFTGCAGNLTAGKYNDGAPENRPVLTGRIYATMCAAEQDSTEIVLDRLEWRVQPLRLPPRADVSEAVLLETIADPSCSKQQRTLAALHRSFLRRTAAGTSIPVTALHLGRHACLLHLPGEAFVEYQLYAQEQRPGDFVAVAAYGDLGMSYIPLERSFQEVGGYEESWAFAAPESERILKRAIDVLLV
jgi:hypothetical protein